MSDWAWVLIIWIFCGSMSLLATYDLDGGRWGKPLLFALGPIGLLLTMIAGARY